MTITWEQLAESATSDPEWEDRLRDMLDEDTRRDPAFWRNLYQATPLPEATVRKFCYVTETGESMIFSEPLALLRMRRMGLTAAEGNPEGTYALLADQDGSTLTLGVIHGELAEAVETMTVIAETSPVPRDNYRLELRVLL